MTLDAKIEAILYWSGEPVSLERLARLAESDVSSVRNALQDLRGKLTGRGTTLVEANGEVSIRTSADAVPLIEKLSREELSRDLGRAGSEVLAIVLYRGPISRRGIDYIRGVNSTFTLRSLLMRGLIERVSDPGDERVFLYRGTTDLLGHLGVERVENLPKYREAREKIETFEQASSKESEGEKEEGSEENRDATD